jgi:DNA polymerase-3 subunit epsilon
MRQIVLDTETTGLDPLQGHKIIEIGCVELIDRRLTGRHYHQYIQPEREIDVGAMEVHGITQEFLKKKPVFSHIAQEFMDFVKGAELIIHNAPFDIGFLDAELANLPHSLGIMKDHCTVLDTLVMARNMHPGRRNSLDALCDRYDINNTSRELHGALLDSEILADVYIAMTSGQTDLALGGQLAGGNSLTQHVEEIIRIASNRAKLTVVEASAEEIERHHEWVAKHRSEDQPNVWPHDGLKPHDELKPNNGLLQ